MSEAPKTSTPIEIPIIGIKNFRSTCFANSVFQILCSQRALIKYLKVVEPTTETPYTFALKKMLKPLLESKTPGIIRESIDPPEEMRKIIIDLQTESGQRQMDAGEFYTTVINALHVESLKIQKPEETQEEDDDGWEEVGEKSKKISLRTEKSDGKSCVSEVFRGKTRMTTTTVDAKKKANKAVFQDFYIFSVPLQKGKDCCKTTNECYNLATSRRVEGNIVQTLSIEEFPKVLVLQFNRFIYDRVQLKVVKITDHVSFEETLSLKVGKKSVNYKLSVVVEHRGNNIGRGHYVAYVRRGPNWFFCNDEQIIKTDFTEVRNAMAYLLVYSN
ncbi:hypothetical protein EIN_268100 [Entamoeba invadens IP1]|uniref:ubiquitinyl hydrolase 1 n=1 Tax=Entamoeba invadens IP1 TaxID=370355 RepID=A0A0A1U817_ENTIV|nr:hypothetical protein EIN_268100 [Entamoeba invadens IP1]ELP91074.1 hypothetical protein EIN_268100 [Entamoeba invadens IP1]|eukprot:XP_004257845.1 hypothetical protein EIN_268100 [Entamoeba invadens IP1]